jgi:Cu-Zn family superoxide dismutase
MNPATTNRRFIGAILPAAVLLAFPALAQQNEMIEVGLMTAGGENAGTVTFEQVDHGVAITARLENLPEGPHGFHIHETGACEPDFGAAGGHYNPLDAAHGFDSPGGYHVGDLPNVYVAADGTATADFFAPQLTLAEEADDDFPFSLRDADGSAIMVHAQIDDYENEPPGSSGDRLACGVIAPAQS